MTNRYFFYFARCVGAYVQLRYIAMLYTHSFGNQPYNMMVMFKMRDSVHSARYYSVCNVLCLCRISLILKACSQYDVTACVALRCFRCVVYVTLRCVLLVHNFASLRYASRSFGDRSVEWRAIATAKMSWSRFYYSHCISG